MFMCYFPRYLPNVFHTATYRMLHVGLRSLDRDSSFLFFIETLLRAYFTPDKLFVLSCYALH